MKYLLILGAVVIVGGVAFLFFGNNEPRVSQITTMGEVTAVDTAGAAADGPVLITIDSPEGELTVAVPSMGLPLCEAVANIADPFAISVGDRVEVSGSVDEEGRIVPCESVSHYLRATSLFINRELGYQFTYRTGPDGYLVVEGVESTHPDFISGETLFNRSEYEELQASTEPREGPPSMQVRVYDNPESLDPSVWLERNPQETNLALAMTEPQEAVVGGANAEHFVADGLFPIDTYIVAHDSRIYLLTGMYPEEGGQMYDDFQDFVMNFVFIPTIRDTTEDQQLQVR